MTNVQIAHIVRDFVHSLPQEATSTDLSQVLALIIASQWHIAGKPKESQDRITEAGSLIVALAITTDKQIQPLFTQLDKLN